MNRTRRVLFMLAVLFSCAFPLLWAPSAWVQLTPLAVGTGWLFLACLIGLGPPLQPFELLLLAVVLTPGLTVTLSTHADLKVLQAYSFAGRVLLALGLHTALTGLLDAEP